MGKLLEIVKRVLDKKQKLEYYTVTVRGANGNIFTIGTLATDSEDACEAVRNYTAECNTVLEAKKG